MIEANGDSEVHRFNKMQELNELNELVVEALKQLEANKILTRGAIVRQKMFELAREKNVDLQMSLNSAGMTFRQLLDRVPDVVVYRRQGTDMFVGLQGAAWPEVSAEREGKDPVGRYQRDRDWVRPDAYEALTRVSSAPCFYIQSQDVFTQNSSNIPSDDLVEFPVVTLDDLLIQRKEFADQQSQESKTELQNSIVHSSNPLAGFQATVTRLRLKQAWHEFKAANLKKRLEEWASTHDIPISPTWFAGRETGSSVERPQDLLARFSMYMTDEEVRSVMVPFRAIEAMYRDQQRSSGR